MMPGVLYISYDGMLEPLGQSQVLAYLKRLAADRPIHLISFEKEDDWAHVAERERVARDIAASGIVWHPLRYHKRPTAVATTWDIANGTRLGLWLVLRHRLRIVHARSYVSSVMALAIKRITGIKYLFDMRGFWADERVDGNLWPRTGRMYRVSKGFERRFLLGADHVVSLTHAAVTEMQRFTYLQGHMPPVTVIPTCADLARFKPMLRRPKSAGLVLGYVGTAGTWYLFDEVVACFAELLHLRLCGIEKRHPCRSAAADCAHGRRYLFHSAGFFQAGVSPYQAGRVAGLRCPLPGQCRRGGHGRSAGRRGRRCGPQGV